MSTGTFDDAANLERLSALVDGELARADVDAACGDWRRDAELRRTWHAWHAIGDALRSDDLICDAQADLSFCAVVSARLATEAVVLAPSRHEKSDALAASVPLRSRWAVGSAVAAGLVLVAGTFALVGPGSAPGPERLALVDGMAASSSVAGSRSMPAGTSLVADADADVSAPQVATVADQQVRRVLGVDVKPRSGTGRLA